MKWLRDELVRHFEQLETERETLRARVAELEAARRRICVIFDGYAGRFVEVENEHGASIRVGEWRERDDGLWSLDIDRWVGTEDSR